MNRNGVYGKQSNINVMFVKAISPNSIGGPINIRYVWDVNEKHEIELCACKSVRYRCCWDTSWLLEYFKQRHICAEP